MELMLRIWRVEISFNYYGRSIGRLIGRSVSQPYKALIKIATIDDDDDVRDVNFFFRSIWFVIDGNIEE